ncbi:MAG TPA: histidine kinase [Marmoricola sp.]|nr:histidine kinase [Marmoricola sp.]
MRAGLTRVDQGVAAGFVLAAAGETLVLHRETAGLLAFGLAGAPVLAVLVVRRTRPVVPITLISVFAVLGTIVQAELWPGASDGGGVWLFALMFAAYSLGAHGRGPLVALGAVLPLLVALAIDLPTMTGWALVSGVLFVTVFVGGLPAAVGRAVRVRRDRIDVLERQLDLIRHEQQVQREAAVLAERLSTTERLQPTLLAGLHSLADRADSGADPGEIEQAARQLLGRTREEVVALTAPVDVPEPSPAPPADHLAPLRAAAQRWAVLGAGALGSALAIESTSTRSLAVPPWLAVTTSVAVCLPLALVWWRPLVAVAATWGALAGFSRLVVPLDGTLSGVTATLAAAFAVAALCTRRGALAGLGLCWLGAIAGVGAVDPLGDAVMIFVFWLGGLAVNEATRLVEQGRTNNRLLARQEQVEQQRAVVEERLRLAREVHDQIGHSLTVVALQAGAARRMVTTDPQRSREVMATIAAAARDGLAAMAGGGPVDLATLLDRTRSAGLDVTADLDGWERLDPVTRELACRVVQEGLTNVLRHAPGSRTTVTVRALAGNVSVAVGNDAPPRRGGVGGTGRGLAGLRELLGPRAGSVCWGPRGDGGFELQALLPVHLLEGSGR